MEKIKLGDEVKCKYTGVKGIAMTRTEFINGCVQFSIAPKWNFKNPPLVDTEISVDSQSLILVKKGERHKKEVKKESTGGPNRLAPKMKGF